MLENRETYRAALAIEGCICGRSLQIVIKKSTTKFDRAKLTAKWKFASLSLIGFHTFCKHALDMCTIYRILSFFFFFLFQLFFYVCIGNASTPSYFTLLVSNCCFLFLFPSRNFFTDKLYRFNGGFCPSGGCFEFLFCFIGI